MANSIWLENILKELTPSRTEMKAYYEKDCELNDCLGLKAKKTR